ncbi:piggyBac transposable element-derived protein 4-like [Macrobrachium rosenbergii]|uniref:piggyBac transposable element-derived protein 4-like n=1 Tax=Macrobrachium rosenbergii TaxID=79674 RepID=UPI0034D7059F
MGPTGSSSSSEESLHDDSENQITEEEQENEEENEEEILNEDTSPPNAEWIKVTKKARQHGFTGKEELCVTVHPSSTDNQIWPIDVYKQIITDDIINLIVQETNRYAEQKISSVTVTRRSKLRQWIPTNNKEIEKFIGLIIYMGLVPFPETQLYWSKSILYKNEIVPKTMSRDRFLLLLQMLHFCNNEEPNVGRDWKIRKLLDMILVQYQSIYKSGSDVIIDESMVPFRGRVIFRQYIPGKSHKYGCKLFKLCTPDGYTLNMELYTGVGVATPPLSKTESLVVRLLANHMDMGVTLFADNYYISSFLESIFFSGRLTYVAQ